MVSGMVVGAGVALLISHAAAQSRGDDYIGQSEESLKIARAAPEVRTWVKALAVPQCPEAALGALRSARGITESRVDGNYAFGYAATAVVVINCLRYKDGTTIATVLVAAERGDDAARYLRTTYDLLGVATPVSRPWRERESRGWPSWAVHGFNASGVSLARCSEAAAAVLGQVVERQSPAPWATVAVGGRSPSRTSITCIVRDNSLRVEIAAASWERKGAAKAAVNRANADIRKRLQIR